MRNISLLDSLDDDRRTEWRPDEPPQLASRGIKSIRLNFETNGLKWWDEHDPISATVMLPDGTIKFLPWGFRGGNLDAAVCKRWAQRELRDLHIENTNTRFEVHMSRKWGVDLEAQNCTVSDVSHYAALLDDHRQRFSLDKMVEDFLPNYPVVPRLNESRMTDYHAEDAAPRARYQVQAVAALHDVLWPRIVKEELKPVADLESKVIFPVCEMEKNGAPIDVELLDRWIKQSAEEYERILWELVKMTGFQTDPGRPEHKIRLFQHYQIPLHYLPPTTTGKVNASFTAEILGGVDHPAINLLRRAIKIASLRSKYLLKYKRNLDSRGIVRFALHQLRAQKDPYADFEAAGTISGRFSSSAIRVGPGEEYGINVQQEMKVAKQRVAFGYDEDDASHDDEIYIIRQLRVPPPELRGKVKWISADAMQEEYRIFASYAGNPAVIRAYQENPLLKFHHYMFDRVAPSVSGLWTIKQQKDLNFAYIYGAGLVKQALMLGHISKAEFNEIKRKKLWNDPRLVRTKEVRAIYKQTLPEVDGLLEMAQHIAMPACGPECRRSDGSLKNPRLHKLYEHRGYVKTILGRRSRFSEGDRFYKAFNCVDQGSAADIMKQKIVEVHAERKHTGFTMCYTVHDEVDGYGEESAATKLSEILNQQSFPQLKVPIMWDVTTGKNWKECA